MTVSRVHARMLDGKRYVWHVDRLWALASDIAPCQVQVNSLSALDSDCWFGDWCEPTLRNVADHARRIYEADLSYPILLGPEREVLDGVHRLAKAYLEGRPTVNAIAFKELPNPDSIVALPSI